MAPIRRYLQITPYTILEVRIYLEDPYSASWLVSPRSDVLPRIMTAVKPHVFRQLRDERERAKGKSKKKKGVKDSVVEEDFEAAVFLTDVATRHSVCVKVKDFEKKKKRQRLGSKEGKLTGWLGGKDRPVELGDDAIGDEVDADGDTGVIILQESDEEQATLQSTTAEGRGKPKATQIRVDDVSEDEGFYQTQVAGSRKTTLHEGGVEGEEDDKKKLALNLSYDGFSIYGKILCLVVKRRKGRGTIDTPADGRQMLENWVSSQAAQEPGLLDD